MYIHSKGKFIIIIIILQLYHSNLTKQSRNIIVLKITFIHNIRIGLKVSNTYEFIHLTYLAYHTKQKLKQTMPTCTNFQNKYNIKQNIQPIINSVFIFFCVRYFKLEVTFFRFKNYNENYTIRKYNEENYVLSHACTREKTYQFFLLSFLLTLLHSH